MRLFKTFKELVARKYQYYKLMRRKTEAIVGVERVDLDATVTTHNIKGEVTRTVVELQECLLPENKD